MIPVLQAEESLRHMTEVAMGSGTLKSEDARQIHREWRRQAGFVDDKPKQTESQFKATLAMMGIGFTEVPKDG